MPAPLAELLSLSLAAAPDLLEPSSLAQLVQTGKPFAILFIGLGSVVALGLAVQDWRRNHVVLGAIRQLEVPPSARLLDQELAKLKARDPGFDRAGFERQVADLFARLQRAREAGEAPPRHEVSDGVFRRAVVEREFERAQGQRQVQADAKLREARLVGAFSDPHFDALHVRVAWTAHDAQVPFELSREEARARAGRMPEHLHAEVWVFVRRPTAKTLAGRAAGNCPNCGAPFSGGAANLCEHCRAILNSGSYGWVLAQQLDFEVYRGPWRQFTGLEELSTRDPGFSPEAIEDRGALVFWKWLQARSERSPGSAARLCAPPMLAALQAEAEQHLAAHKRRWASNVCVAGVDLLLMELDAEEGVDEVCVRVRWSGQVAEFDDKAPPKVPRGSYATVLTLVRDSRVATDVTTGVSSDRCHACKAASQDSDAALCAFCGAALEPGRHDFVLREARPFEDWMATRQQRGAVAAAVEPFLPSFKFADERQRLLEMMAAMVRADGEVSSSERALIKLCCRRWGIDFPLIRPVLDGEAPAPEVRLEKGSWPARAFLEGLCDAAAIDGVVDRKERALLVAVARRLELEIPTVHSLKLRADRVRRSLREAGLHDG